MTSERKIKRNARKKVLKKRIDETLDLLETSRSEWKRQKVKVVGKGEKCEINQTRFMRGDNPKYGRIEMGHKPSLFEQYCVLFDLYKSRQENKKILEELEQRIKERKEMEIEDGR